MGDQVQMQNVERDEMLALSSQILRDLGTPPDDALSVADSLVQAQEAGHASHGVIRLIEYTSFVERGWVIPTGQPTIVSDRGAVALIAIEDEFVNGAGARLHVKMRWMLQRKKRSHWERQLSRFAHAITLVDLASTLKHWPAEI